MLLDELKLANKSAKAEADGTLLMLLSLNFLLLAFFILMNSIATRESAHAKNVLARVREGYNIQGPLGDNAGGVAPVVAKAPWQGPLVSRLQGVILNRLNLQTIPLETDADKLVMVLPLASLFDGPRLREPQTVRNIVTAAGTTASLRWEILGRWPNQELLAAQAATLAAETGRVAVGAGNDSVRITFTPALTTDPDVGATLQNLGLDGGASSVEGVGDGD